MNDDALILFDLLVRTYGAEPAEAFEVAAWYRLEYGRTGTSPAEDAIVSRLSEARVVRASDGSRGAR